MFSANALSSVKKIGYEILWKWKCFVSDRTIVRERTAKEVAVISYKISTDIRESRFLDFKLWLIGSFWRIARSAKRVDKIGTMKGRKCGPLQQFSLVWRLCLWHRCMKAAVGVAFIGISWAVVHTQFREFSMKWMFIDTIHYETDLKRSNFRCAAKHAAKGIQNFLTWSDHPLLKFASSKMERIS